MSSFQYNVKKVEEKAPITIDDDDDDDSDDELSGSKRKKKIIPPKSNKRHIEKVNHDDDDGIVILPATKPMSSTSRREIGSSHHHIPSSISRSSSISQSMPLPSSSNTDYSDDKDLAAAQALLSRITSAKSTFTSSHSHDDKEVVELLEDEVYIPSMKSYHNRSHHNVTDLTSSPSEFKLSDIHDLIGMTAPVYEAIVSMPVEDAAASNEEKVKIKTRVNGKHEWRWKVGKTENIGKMKVKFSQIYGVPVKDVKYTLDGETLDDDETCQSLDIEDDTMIDVKIPAMLLDAAVAKAKEYSANPQHKSVILSSSSSTASSSSVSSSSTASSSIASSKPANTIIGDNITEVVIRMSKSNTDPTRRSLVTKAVVKLIVPRTHTLRRLQEILYQNNHISSIDAVEFSISDPSTVVDNTKTIAELNLASGAELITIPARIKLCMIIHSSTKLKSTPIDLIARTDYQFNIITDMFCKHMKIAPTSIRFEIGGKFITDTSKTIEELGVKNEQKVMIKPAAKK